MNNIKVDGNFVQVNGFVIEFDSNEKVNSFLLDYITKNGMVFVEDVPTHEKVNNQYLDSLIDKYGCITIEYLDLSVRSYNVLKRAGINYIEDILTRSYDDMARVRNMGRRSLQEIQIHVNEVLGENYIQWVQETEFITI